MEPIVGAVAGALISLLISRFDHRQGSDKCVRKTLECPVTYAVMLYFATAGAVIGIVASIFGS